VPDTPSFRIVLFGISRPTKHRRYDYALSVIAWRLNGRQAHLRRGRRFVIARLG
jgi:hypothetical protein